MLDYALLLDMGNLFYGCRAERFLCLIGLVAWLHKIAKGPRTVTPLSRIWGPQVQRSCVSIERRSVTSRYHGSKICGSQQSFFTEKVVCIDERWKKNTANYRFVPEWNHAQESHTCHFFLFYFCNIYKTMVCWDPGFSCSRGARIALSIYTG